MGSFSIWHWLVVGIIILLLFGKGRFSEMMGDVAKGIKSFKKGMSEEEAAAQAQAQQQQQPPRRIADERVIDNVPPPAAQPPSQTSAPEPVASERPPSPDADRH